jgi:hypothetical protein
MRIVVSLPNVLVVATGLLPDVQETISKAARHGEPRPLHFAAAKMPKIGRPRGAEAGIKEYLCGERVTWPSHSAIPMLAWPPSLSKPARALDPSIRTGARAS